jgi:hypothetical protein
MRSLLATALMSILLAASSALAQSTGTPGTGPLFPGGPRQGIGPPSITDAVPDIRLRQDGGGIPGAGPPIDYSRPSTSSYGQPVVGARGLSRSRQIAARHCETPRATCRLGRAVPLGEPCLCRTRGKTVRGYGVP